MKLNDAVEAVSATFHVLPQDILSTRRSRPVAHARQVVCFLLHRNAGMTYSEVARVMRLDHSTVLHGCSQVEVRRHADPEYNGQVEKARRLAMQPDAERRGVRPAEVMDVSVRPARGKIVPVKVHLVIGPDGSYAAFGSSGCTPEVAEVTARQTLGSASDSTTYEVWMDLDVHLKVREE